MIQLLQRYQKLKEVPLPGLLFLAVFTAFFDNILLPINTDSDYYLQIYEGASRFVLEYPDQLRILPVLIYKLCRFFFSPLTSFLVIKIAFLFLYFVVFYMNYPAISLNKKKFFLVAFAFIYPLSMKMGWRVDSGIQLFLNEAALFAMLYLRAHRILILALYAFLYSLCRTDQALLFVIILFAEFGDRKNIFHYLVLLIPLIVHFGLSSLFINTGPIHIDYGSKGYIVQTIYNPLFYLVLALLVFWWEQVKMTAQYIFRHKRYVLVLFVMYLGVVFYYGRLVEFRIYLPFIPFLVYYAASSIQIRQEA